MEDKQNKISIGLNPNARVATATKKLGSLTSGPKKPRKIWIINLN